jgi:hypothetical protein
MTTIQQCRVSPETAWRVDDALPSWRTGDDRAEPSPAPADRRAEPALQRSAGGDVSSCTGCAEGCSAWARLAGGSDGMAGAHATWPHEETLRDRGDGPMAQKGRGIFLVYVDIDAQQDQEFNAWYNT